MVCEDCGNIIGDQVIPGLRHAVPAEQMQVHPAASRPIDFPLFVAGTEIVVEGDKIVEITSPRGRKILQLNSEEGREEDRPQVNYQPLTSSSFSRAGSSQAYHLCNEVEGERGQYQDPYSAVETVEENNDPYNRLEVDVIMLEDSLDVSQLDSEELLGPLKLGQGGKFLAEDLHEAGEERTKLTAQSGNEKEPRVAQQTKFHDSPGVTEASQIKLTNHNYWEVDEIITQVEPPQKVTEVGPGEPLTEPEADEVLVIDPHTAPPSDGVHTAERVSCIRAVNPPVVAEVDHVEALDPPVVAEVDNVNAGDPVQGPEDSQAGVLEPEDPPGRLQIQLDASPGPAVVKVTPGQEVMTLQHSSSPGPGVMTLQHRCFRCGSSDSTGPWHKHKRRQHSYLCHLCFSYYR